MMPYALRLMPYVLYLVAGEIGKADKSEAEEARVGLGSAHELHQHLRHT